MYVVKKDAFNMHTAVLFTQTKPGSCIYKFELSVLIKFWFTMPMLPSIALTILIVEHILYVVYKGTTMICQISDYFSRLLHEERIVVIPILN